jgi:hypothetical protein
MYNDVYTPSVKEVNLSISIVCVYRDNQAVFTVEYDNYSPFLTRSLCPINKHTLSIRDGT